MYLYSDESRSWCSAAPMVRISANTSKPSNVHPRFEAISVFHCVRLSERYHGEYSKVADDPLMIASLKFAKGRTSRRQRVKLTIMSRALGIARYGSHQLTRPRVREWGFVPIAKYGTD